MRNIHKKLLTNKNLIDNKQQPKFKKKIKIHIWHIKSLWIGIKPTYFKKLEIQSKDFLISCNV